MIPTAKNNTCKVIINIHNLKIPNTNNIKNKTIILTPTINTIIITYSPHSKPIISINNTNNILTKIKITKTLKIIITTQLKKNQLNNNSLFSHNLSKTTKNTKHISFKINKNNINTTIPIITITQNKLYHKNLNIIKYPNTNTNTKIIQIIPLNNNNTLTQHQSSNISHKITNTTT